MNFIKNTLFYALIIFGLIVIILFVILCILELLNRIFGFTKYIIMHHRQKKNSVLYDLKDKLVISKDGRIFYSCVVDLDRQSEILEKAILHIREIKTLQRKYSNNTKESDSLKNPI